MTEAARANPHLGFWQTELQRASASVRAVRPYEISGKIIRATGLVLEALGLSVPLGGACRIELPDGGHAEAEVVGFAGSKSYLMPLAELSGLTPGARVFPISEGSSARCFPLGPELLGRVLDGSGRPLDE